MKKFEQKVNFSSIEEMAGFLAGHFRYSVVNGWNPQTSYANNLKVYDVGLDSGTQARILDLMNTEDFWDEINHLVWMFGYEHSFEWEAAFNGRSGGYLVLYNSRQEPSGYRSFCTACGQKNYKTVEESGTRCGRCGRDSRINFTHPDMLVKTSMCGIDMDEDEDAYADWDAYELAERARVVCDFDRLCDRIVAAAVRMGEDYDVEDEEYVVTKTRKILVPKSA